MTQTAEEKIVNISLKDLHVSETNPRKRFDPVRLKELQNSIVQEGVVQPIVVRPSHKVGYGFEIVCGARRFHASESAGLKTIPAVVRDISDGEIAGIQIIENLH